ncbi:MAG: RpiB/LacA/LacB family sugar-phosphate isomerase [Patescibacteria group bacterium]|nr:RpiB/LacA/LacB family sugar-phosphate isomerase [Patescibacteria group bacterium]MDE2015411.1 RpiB/LacA/LacB family sugar-phosphate isomerase [Patescibacteria group bacterium]MDE2226974.1 RpiB/LacA/LacB family sugar-phosphate isomerase [Patescibacteria group bacterium]
MLIYIGADHRGFKFKERLKAILHDQGYEVTDVGNEIYDEKDDYPDFAAEVGRRVSAESGGNRGVLICGSGAGVDIVANKFHDVRSVLGISTDQVFDARHDDDVNVLSLSADFTSEADAEKMVRVFLDTPFSGEERHKRRLKKIAAADNQ